MKIADDFVTGVPGHPRTSSHDSSGPDSGSKHGGNAADPPEGQAEAAEGPAASGSSSGLIQILVRFVEDMVGSADGLIEIYADRLRLSVRRRVVQAVIITGVAVCTAIWLGAAALAVFRGVCGGFTTLWGGREWLGNLTGGVFALSLAASATVIYLRLSSRRDLGRLKAKYERIRNAHSKNHDTASPAADGRRVP